MISPGGKEGKPYREPTEPTELTAPTEEKWRRTIDFFLVLRTLGSAASRRRADKLAEALEREALDVFRVARRLENELPPVLDLKERAVEHGRPSIVARLRDFTKRHVDLAQLDDLDEQLGRSAASWYRQGGLLLDALERVRAHVAAYEYVDAQRPPDEPGTVAWSYLTAEAVRWGASDGEVAQRLADAGYVQDDRDMIRRIDRALIDKLHTSRSSRPPRTCCSEDRRGSARRPSPGILGSPRSSAVTAYGGQATQTSRAASTPSRTRATDARHRATPWAPANTRLRCKQCGGVPDVPGELVLVGTRAHIRVERSDHHRGAATASC